MLVKTLSTNKKTYSSQTHFQTEINLLSVQLFRRFLSFPLIIFLHGQSSQITQKHGIKAH